MRLLVSVIGSGEVRAAIAGGADIVDVKDPAGGPLGRPPALVVASVRAAVTAPQLMSVALGDATVMSGELAATARGFAIHQVDFIKIGLVGGPKHAEGLLRGLVEAVGEVNPGVRIVGLTYADAPGTLPLSPLSLPALAAASGAHGVMLDTVNKDGTSLLTHLQETCLRTFVALAHDAGLLAGLAGSLGVPEIKRLKDVNPDVVGVRGAACAGGRDGLVDAARVRGLAQVLRPVAALPRVSASHSKPGGTTLGK